MKPIKTFISFFLILPKYVSKRVSQITLLILATSKALSKLSDILKYKLVTRMFWGRGNTYKNLTLSIMIIITVSVTLTGILTRVYSVSADKNLYGDKIIGLEDLLQQGGSIETVLGTDPTLGGIKIQKHKVQEGETLDSIAAKYNISMDTIRWASSDILSPFTNEVKEGWILSIPEINGVLYKIKRDGQSIQDVIKDTGGNEFDIAQFNNLQPPYSFKAGQAVFIPDGNLYRPDVQVQGIPRGIFINPLSHPDCGGYSISRGFLYYHNGVDMARWPSCPIEAVANGYVYFAGWSSDGSGYNVKLDHGGGIITHYYHGDGTIWVKTGDRVQQGQPLMMMGCTGNCTGTHLHFSLFKNGVAVDPYGYVPY